MAPASGTKYYLSLNSSLDAGDVLVGSRPVSALGPGLSDIGSTLLQIPASMAAGTYYLIANADDDGVIAEALENNNTRMRFITISAAP